MNKDRRQQIARIERMRRKLGMPCPPLSKSTQASLDAQERTLRNLIALEETKSTTLARQLISDGIELPPPDELVGDALAAKLREVIYGMAAHRTFLEGTDRLSDAELYHHLWTKTLNELDMEMDESMEDFARHIDVSAELACDSEDFFELPVDLPFDRDRLLPKPGFPGTL